MGAYSPAPIVTPALHARIMREVIEPTLRGLAADGTPYTGFLYAGLMIAADGTPNVLEYNCRFGDPETQPVLARLRSDLTGLCTAALAGRLDRVRAAWDSRAALGVVLAAAGYPETVRKGDVICGLDAAARLPGKVFHAATRVTSDGESRTVTTDGGRVLCAVGLGDSVRAAQAEAYALAQLISWPGMQYRRDIGYRALSAGVLKARPHENFGAPQADAHDAGIGSRHRFEFQPHHRVAGTDRDIRRPTKLSIGVKITEHPGGAVARGVQILGECRD